MKDRKCLCCGAILAKPSQLKFCSQSCSARYNNVGKAKNPNGYNGVKTKETEVNYNKGVIVQETKCVHCGKPLIARQSKFCSVKCSRAYTHNEYISRWKNGDENGVKGEYQLSSHIKRYFMEKYNCKCQLCGWGERNPSTNTIPLEMHHVDGDYKNNKEENLQLLCPNCHSLTETYKSHNKNGRTGRSKYR